MALEQEPTERIASRSADPGADGMLSLLVVRDGETSTYPLPTTPGRLVIGRAPTADVRIEHGSVSREHAALHVGPGIRIEDLGSANGTRVRDVPLATGAVLEVFPDDVIDLGAVLLVLQYRNLAARVRRACHPAELELRVEEECEQGRAFALVRLEVEGGPGAHAVQVFLASALRVDDLLAAEGSGRFTVLLLGALPDEADKRLRMLLERLAQRDVRARASVTAFPRDTETAAELPGRRVPRAPPVAADKSTAPHVVARGSGDGARRTPAQTRRGQPAQRAASGRDGRRQGGMRRAMHAWSSRADKPFVRFNCASLSETLLDDELFGHDRGAFTGATSERAGLLESGSGGTVFLDEIGDIPLATQLKLLRVLESREVRRLGSVKLRTIDIRIVAATHQDLRERITEGRFREDLFYRLDGISIVIPPLRDRPGDIDPLARHFAARASRRAESPAALAPEAIDRLMAHEWPGNVRELRNVIERAAVLCEGPTIKVEHLRMNVDSKSVAASSPASRQRASEPGGVSAQTPNLRNQVKALERERIERALLTSGGNQRMAAEALGISRGALLRRLEQLGLPRPRKA